MYEGYHCLRWKGKRYRGTCKLKRTLLNDSNLAKAGYYNYHVARFLCKCVAVTWDDGIERETYIDKKS